jgi:hypothetical protein
MITPFIVIELVDKPLTSESADLPIVEKPDVSGMDSPAGYRWRILTIPLPVIAQRIGDHDCAPGGINIHHTQPYNMHNLADSWQLTMVIVLPIAVEHD